MKKHRVTEYIPQYDDYELKPHYDFDYRKTQPNRFAALLDASSKPASRVRKKASANGKPTRATRKTKTPRAKRHTITLHEADAEYLYSLDKSLSHAIRKLILMQRGIS